MKWDIYKLPGVDGIKCQSLAPEKTSMCQSQKALPLPSMQLKMITNKFEINCVFCIKWHYSKCLGNASATHCWLFSGITLCLCAQDQGLSSSVKKKREEG